jgi:hypothetical protein
LVRSRTQETIDAPCYPLPALYEPRARKYKQQIVGIGIGQRRLAMPLIDERHIDFRYFLNLLGL